MTTRIPALSQPLKAVWIQGLDAIRHMPAYAWRCCVCAAALAIGLVAQDAHALALGRVNVLSALGEPLRAEIDVPEITKEEAASLKLSLASPDAFRAAAMEYNPVLLNLQISLQRRANGTAFVRLLSDRAVNEPFVDLILETSWASGRIVRDYTLLFDPANQRASVAPAVTPPRMDTPETMAVKPAVSAPVSSTIKSAPAPRPTPTNGLVVKPGDTASALVARYKAAGVSLDQMLVAMLQANPDAFVNSNVNRLKSGAVIDMQATNAMAANIGESQAKQTIAAQAKDFNVFRRRLAAHVRTANAASPSRAASGKVQAAVNETVAQALTPDKLTLSKGSVTAKTKVDAIATKMQEKDNTSRIAELSKNIQDLNQLRAASPSNTAAVGAAPAPAPSAKSSAPGVNLSGSLPSVSAASTAIASQTASLAASQNQAFTSVASASPSVATVLPTSSASATVAPRPVPDAPAEIGLIDHLTNHPMTLPGAAALLAGLGVFALWRVRQRRKAAQSQSSFVDSRLQPDSFFGVSGGQVVDTAEPSNQMSGVGNSMLYSPSQLDAAGDVDLVAEADVYLAYGRDLQAEEILKEALRSHPSRSVVHAKLMEIYAKRRDVKAFEAIAKEAFKLTQGEGADWQAAAERGRQIDPSNPLYVQRSASQLSGTSAVAKAAAQDNTEITSAQRSSFGDSQAFDLDFDLDLSADSPTPARAQSSVIASLQESRPGKSANAALDESPRVSFGKDLNFSSPPSASSTPFTAPTAPTAPMALKLAPSEHAALGLEMREISLDLSDPSNNVDSKSAQLSSTDNHMETKLSLAIELRSIGDVDGARSLIQEVIDEATGPTKARALKMRSELG